MKAKLLASITDGEGFDVTAGTVVELLDLIDTETYLAALPDVEVWFEVRVDQMEIIRE